MRNHLHQWIQHQRELLHRSALLFDNHGNGLADSARRSVAGGFSSGGEWMGEALAVLRSEPTNLSKSRNFSSLGFWKYAICGFSGLGFFCLGCVFHVPLILSFLLFIVGFYAAEVQMLFLFPFVLDGSTSPFQDSSHLMRKTIGTQRAVIEVLPIAAFMLFGGLFGRGFLRSWTLGCISILLWYEEVRSREGVCSITESRSKLELCAAHRLEVRVEQIALRNTTTGLRMLFLSDFHLGICATRKILDETLDRVREVRPDVIVLGGDYVDNQSGEPEFLEFVKAIVEICPVAAIPGNHDLFYGEKRIRRMLKELGVTWLPDESLRIESHDVQFESPLCSNEKRGGAANRVLCVHDPEETLWKRVSEYSLILAGHLHGSQCVLREKNGALYPGRWFFRWNVLREDVQGTPLIVSRGINDTLPIRWNCPREVLLCELR